MKWALCVACLMTVDVLAADDCEVECREAVNACAEMCQMALEFQAPEQISVCKEQCKVMALECRKECDEDQKKKVR